MGHGTLVRQRRGGLVDDLIETHGGKIRELHFDDRPQPFDRGADGQSHDGILANRRVEHAAGKFLRQILRGLERAAERGDVLPVNKHTRIVAQSAPAPRKWHRRK